MGVLVSLVGVLAQRSLLNPNISAFTLVNLDAGPSPVNQIQNILFAAGNANRMLCVSYDVPTATDNFVFSTDAYVTKSVVPMYIAGLVPMYMSADGQTIYARVDDTDGLYKTIDGGNSWSTPASPRVYHVSKDGQKMIGLIGAGLRYSTNGGVLFQTPTGAPTFDGATGVLRCSNNGNNVLVVPGPTYTTYYRSTNGGASYSSFAGAAAYGYRGLQIDDNGTVWGLNGSDQVWRYISSWVQVASGVPSQPGWFNQNDWIDSGANAGYVMSADGRIQATDGGQLSVDYGVTWTSFGALIPKISINNYIVAISDDGLKLGLVARNTGQTDDALYVNR